MPDNNKAKLKEAVQILLSYQDQFVGTDDYKKYFSDLEDGARAEDILPKLMKSGKDGYGNAPDYGYGEPETDKKKIVEDLDAAFKVLLTWDTKSEEVKDALRHIHEAYLNTVRPDLEQSQVKKAAAISEVKEAIKTILIYKDDLPEDLRTAIGSLCEFAVAKVSNGASGEEDGSDED